MALSAARGPDRQPAQAERQRECRARLRNHDGRDGFAIAGAREVVVLVAGGGPERAREPLEERRIEEFGRVRDRSGGEHVLEDRLANVGVDGMESSDMAKKLMDEHGIFAVSINTSGVNGCRISPNVFTSIEELDALMAALKSMG